LICHRGQLLDVDYRVCDGPGNDGASACHGCLGPAAATGAAAFTVASAVRAIERRLPPTPARHLRHAAGRLAALSGRDSEAERQAHARMRHMQRISADVTTFLAPSRFMRDRFIRFGVAPERIVLSRYGFDRQPYRQLNRA